MSSADIHEVLSGHAAPGLHRLAGVTAEEVAEMAAGHGWVALVVGLTGAGTKTGLLAAFADAGRFPDWVGVNWDALQDALGDLSWLGPADGYLTVLVGWDDFAVTAPADAAVVESVLSAASSEWSDRGTPFVTVVV